jgi:dolichol-phosphate mannosyltransferase
MRDEASGVWSRFAKSFAFNNTEALIRIPVIALMVESWHFSAVFAAAITLVVAFLLRFVFHSLVVYAPKRPGEAPSRIRHLVDELDAQATSPGEH